MTSLSISLAKAFAYCITLVVPSCVLLGEAGTVLVLIDWPNKLEQLPRFYD